MHRLVSFVTVCVACSSKSSPPAPAGSATPPVIAAHADAAPPPAPKFAVRDEQAKQLLLAAATIPEDEVVREVPKREHADTYNAYAEYTNGTSDEHPSPPIVETCASFLTDADVRKRVLAARCVGNGAGRALKAPSPLRAPIVEIVTSAIEHEQNTFVRRTFASALDNIVEAKELTPEPGLPAPIVDRLVALLPTLTSDSDLQARVFRATFTPTFLVDGSHMLPSIEAFTLAQIAKDTPGDMTSAAYDALPRIADQTKVCKAMASLLRPDAKTVGSVIGFVANRNCDDLVDRAIDLAVSRAPDNIEALAVLDTFEQLRILPAATRARVAAALKAERDKVAAKDRSIVDHYAQVFAHKRNVPCADGIPC